MSEPTTNAPPIVLIHGLWMTARSWDRWVEYYRAKGHEVIVPTYPGFEIEVEALREKPEIIAEASVPETLDHLSEVVERLDRPPIIMGHSFGGTFTQLLVNRGLGAAAVVIDSAPPEGVRVNPPSQIKSLFPILKNPANRHRAVGFTKEQFHYAFANTVSREESDAAYDRLHIPAPGNWVWAYGLIANLKPGHQETWVDYDLDERAPLLFITGGKDHLMPPRCTARTRRSTATPRRRPRPTSSRTALTSPVASLAGSRWPTTRSSGRRATRKSGRADKPPTAAAWPRRATTRTPMPRSGLRPTMPLVVRMVTCVLPACACAAALPGQRVQPKVEVLAFRVEFGSVDVGEFLVGPASHRLVGPRLSRGGEKQCDVAVRVGCPKRPRSIRALT